MRGEGSAKQDVCRAALAACTDQEVFPDSVFLWVIARHPALPLLPTTIAPEPVPMRFSAQGAGLKVLHSLPYPPVPPPPALHPSFPCFIHASSFSCESWRSFSPLVTGSPWWGVAVKRIIAINHLINYQQNQLQHHSVASPERKLCGFNAAAWTRQVLCLTTAVGQEGTELWGWSLLLPHPPGLSQWDNMLGFVMSAFRDFVA